MTRTTAGRAHHQWPKLMSGFLPRFLGGGVFHASGGTVSVRVLLSSIVTVICSLTSSSRAPLCNGAPYGNSGTLASERHISVPNIAYK